MVKFIEILDYVGIIDGTVTCSCCKRESKDLFIYKHDKELVALCDDCKMFIEDLLE